MEITYLYRGNRTSLFIRDYCNNFDKFIKFGCKNTIYKKSNIHNKD